MPLSSKVQAGCAVTLLAVSLAGCTASSGCRKETCKDDDKSVSLNPIIGLFGMAVDGDDKDDYEHLVNDDENCKCKHKH